MKQPKSALILYPNQLFSPDLLPKTDIIYLVEEPLFFGIDNSRPLSLHKQKLILHRASMRRYCEEVLWQNDLNVEYVELKEIEFTADVLVRAQEAGAEVVMVFDPTDVIIESRLKKALDETVETPFELRILPTPSFLLKRGEVRDYFASKTHHAFNDFYQWQRERFNVLIDEDYRPVGERWIIEAKQQILPEGHVPPGFKAFGDNQYVADAKKWVMEHFGDNPGDIESFIWPTTHQEAATWLNDFIKNRLEAWSVYREALDPPAMMLFHSGLGAMLNSGLLTPKQVINELLSAHKKNPIFLPSLEGFIREIIGWREYIRGLYVTQIITAKQPVAVTQTRALSGQWWVGNTGILPLDDVIKKVQMHAYASQAERLMIMANFMKLCDINPDEIYRWFASMFIDTYDWLLVPNIYGLAQLSDLGGIFSKPYISSADYILSVSHYQKDIWCDIWDGLYWAYVEKHKIALSKTRHLKTTVEHLPKITAEHRRIIGYRAQDFLATIS